VVGRLIRLARYLGLVLAELFRRLGLPACVLALEKPELVAGSKGPGLLLLRALGLVLLAALKEKSLRFWEELLDSSKSVKRKDLST